MPKRDEFFAEPIGEERGRELFEATTDEYVAHEKVFFRWFFCVKILIFDKFCEFLLIFFAKSLSKSHSRTIFRVQD